MLLLCITDMHGVLIAFLSPLWSISLVFFILLLFISSHLAGHPIYQQRGVFHGEYLFVFYLGRPVGHSVCGLGFPLNTGFGAPWLVPLAELAKSAVQSAVRHGGPFSSSFHPLIVWHSSMQSTVLKKIIPFKFFGYPYKTVDELIPLMASRYQVYQLSVKDSSLVSSLDLLDDENSSP
ncbi:hypothetical protein PGT21_023865 [Puccinia graminis f. sp. tritici]|uniref:Uncharacterized protein n=1 Tax=Puccinia graminis f. sp. tritici TaxID=56615 RepID=A0A5B0NCV9_PUCGR|nr:hypothetical protein PGT21_023865 [Puccinia graminis f. sp. tritici]